MAATKKSTSKCNVAIVIFVAAMVIACIAVPIYISTLERPTEETPTSDESTSSRDGNRPPDSHVTSSHVHHVTSSHVHPVQVTSSSGTSVHITTAVQSTSAQSTLSSDVPYTSQGALQFQHGQFLLNGSEFGIFSGAFHYFRTVPENWMSILKKLRSCGLNTVETYVPWNQHEEYPGEFNFDWILDVRRFLQTAHDAGLYVIFRPGPYICSEWDFGGLPAWLLRDPDMRVRSNYPGYTAAVERFFGKLLPLVADMQYSNGGPIIAFQIENEYGSYSSDVEHLRFLKNLYTQHGLRELFLTSDNLAGLTKDVFYQEALPTANFKDFNEGRQLFDQIRAWSPEFPLMVTEFWTGWFDHWTSKHEGLDISEYEKYFTSILDANSSFNLYMFHGGTNFAFMNGANQFEGSTYKPDVTSYDYDAVLTEAGDYTAKYHETREILSKRFGMELPPLPDQSTKMAYDSVSVDGFLPLDSMLQTIDSHRGAPVPMEMLSHHGKYGQNYGYILYRCEIPANTSQISFSDRPTDRAQVFLDGKQVAVIDWKSTVFKVDLPNAANKLEANLRLDILVENHGRVNYGTEESGVLNNQRKGIHGSVSCDEKMIKTMEMYPLDFQAGFVNRTDWSNVTEGVSVPGLFKTSLELKSSPADTFVYLKGWGKGILFVNGFNLGRYWSAGPQQTLYLPAPILQQGSNDIVIFEQEKVGGEVMFLDKPILDINDQSEIKL